MDDIACSPKEPWKTIAISAWLLCCLPPGAASAQATIRGLVTDLDGGPVEGARCTFTHLGQNLSIPVTSGDGGRFIRAGLLSGDYEVVCELSQYFHEPVVVHVGAERERNLRLEMVKVATESANYADGFQSFSEGRFEEAISRMELALNEDPTDVRAEYIIGLSLAELGNHQEALERLNRVARTETELAQSSMLNLGIGRTYFMMGEEETAEKYFQKADNPKEVSSMFADAGTRAFNGGQVEHAEQYFQKALQADSQNVDALFGLGLCHIRANRGDAALEVLSRLVFEWPEHEKAKLAKDLIQKLEEVE